MNTTRKEREEEAEAREGVRGKDAGKHPQNIRRKKSEMMRERASPIHGISDQKDMKGGTPGRGRTPLGNREPILRRSWGMVRFRQGWVGECEGGGGGEPKG